MVRAPGAGAQPSLFDLEPVAAVEERPADDQPTEYRHEVLVGDCLHVIVSIYPQPDASCQELAEWTHAERCEGAS